MPNPLSAAQLAAHAKVMDFRSNFNNAAKQIFTAYTLGDLIIPGQGVQELKRVESQCDFQIGSSTGPAGGMLALNFGAGAFRTPVYDEFEGILVHQFTAPYETIEYEGSGPIHRVNDTHVREMDQLVAKVNVIYIEGLFPFTSSGNFLPYYDVSLCQPLEPDERPEELREVNIARVRHRIRWKIRRSAWPVS